MPQMPHKLGQSTLARLPLGFSQTPGLMNSTISIIWRCPPLFFFFFGFAIWLVGLSSPTRDGTCSPCSGSVES